MAKIIFFDTLFKDSGWITLAKSLGQECYKEELISHKKWKSGEYKDYNEWIDESIKLYMKYSLNKEKFENAINSISYFEGVKETFIELHKKGYKMCIISGGLMYHARRAMKDLNIEEAYTACELFFDEKGNVKDWKITLCDYENKTKIMLKVLKRENISIEDAVFVGDGRNDVDIAKTSGISFAFNAKDELKEVTTHIIKDFRELLNFL